MFRPLPERPNCGRRFTLADNISLLFGKSRNLFNPNTKVIDGFVWNVVYDPLMHDTNWKWQPFVSQSLDGTSILSIVTENIFALIQTIKITVAGFKVSPTSIRIENQITEFSSKYWTNERRRGIKCISTNKLISEVITVDLNTVR